MITGLEVAPLVYGLVSAFAGVGALYQNWCRDRRERRTRNEALAASSLEQGQTLIRREYDKGTAYFGQQFEVGDGKHLQPQPSQQQYLQANKLTDSISATELCRQDLAHQVKIIEAVIPQLKEALHGGRPVNPSELASVSNNTQYKAISALESQFRRLMRTCIPRTIRRIASRSQSGHRGTSAPIATLTRKLSRSSLRDGSPGADEELSRSRSRGRHRHIWDSSNSSRSRSRRHSHRRSRNRSRNQRRYLDETSRGRTRAQSPSPERIHSIPNYSQDFGRGDLRKPPSALSDGTWRSGPSVTVISSRPRHGARLPANTNPRAFSNALPSEMRQSRSAQSIASGASGPSIRVYQASEVTGSSERRARSPSRLTVGRSGAPASCSFTARSPHRKPSLPRSAYSTPVSRTHSVILYAPPPARDSRVITVAGGQYSSRPNPTGKTKEVIIPATKPAELPSWYLRPRKEGSPSHRTA